MFAVVDAASAFKCHDRLHLSVARRRCNGCSSTQCSAGGATTVASSLAALFAACAA